MSKEKVRGREFLHYIWIEKKMMQRPFIFLFEFQKELWYIWQLVGEGSVWVFIVLILCLQWTYGIFEIVIL